MRERQISIRDVPEALDEWMEAEGDARRISQKDFLLKVLESAAENSLGRLRGLKDASQGNPTTVEVYDVK